MKKFEDIFVVEDTQEFVIEGVGTFSYKPTTSAEENAWSDEYIEFGERVNEAGKKEVYFKQNLAKLNECKMRNLQQVPFEKEHIKKIIGFDKTWDQLSKEQRWQVLGKLRPEVFNQIIQHMKRIDSPLQKDSSTSSVTGQQTTENHSTQENNTNSPNTSSGNKE